MKHVRENETFFSFLSAVLLTAGLLALFRFTYVPGSASPFHTEFGYLTSPLYYFYISMFLISSFILLFIALRWFRTRWELRYADMDWIGQDALTIERLNELDVWLHDAVQFDGDSIFGQRLIECVEHIRQARAVNGSIDLRFIIEHSENRDDDAMINIYRPFDIMVYIILFIGFSAFSVGIGDAIGSLSTMNSSSSDPTAMSNIMETMALRMASASNAIKYSFIFAIAPYAALAYVKSRNHAALSIIKTAVITRFFNRLPAEITRQFSAAADRPPAAN